MKLKDCVKCLKIKELVGDDDVVFEHLVFDSRCVSAGDMFVAVVGTGSDGHDYIGKAVAGGASVVVCERLPESCAANVTYVVVDDSAAALGNLAAAYYDNPSQKLTLVGVTGTNGKTTIATTLYNLVRRLGYKCGLISTIKVNIEDSELPATHTTPDPLQLNKYLAMMVDAGCDYCFMEVSSHAIVQKRIAGLHFAGGIFTNITHDHLDYHKTFKKYIRAKQLFFTGLPKGAFALTNVDDKNGLVMLQRTKARKYLYSLTTVADFTATVLESHFDGMLLKIANMEFWVKFVGRFNAYNLLAVYGVALLLHFDISEVVTALSELQPVEGRFEALRSPRGVTAIVDYAHTPDALQNVIVTIKDILRGGALITVVGCGGDRDKTKRPEMAAIAASLSDKVIFTSDNPRSEDPEAIIHDMEAGVSSDDKPKTLHIVNRAEAIKTACMLASKKDVILIAGKGHEKYQDIGGVKHHFDDKEIVMNIFKENSL